MPQRNGPDVFFSFPGRKGSVSWFPFSLKALAFASEQILLTLRCPRGRRSILNSIKVPIREFTLLPPGFRRPLTFSESITASNFLKCYRYTRSQGIHVYEYIAEYNTRRRRRDLNRNDRYSYIVRPMFESPAQKQIYV